eukprot:CAMPEP_0176302044 /NCGR_PEP_ID=MMETSP0121_2-20121125/61175_1 /TAXON_ID=160619 /ORGANISM="Kryptoperidinium foliaceum, Strain CCMP 1326" /LENGTH=48 /DNA_ID= /DNA_START= /DNA_END= /DNA_ORIENTATION=
MWPQMPPHAMAATAAAGGMPMAPMGMMPPMGMSMSGAVHASAGRGMPG